MGRFTRQVLVRLALAALLAAGALALAGCTQQEMSGSTAEPAAMDAEKTMGDMSSSGMASDANSQGCSACTTGEEPAPAQGTVEMMDGAQVVTVGIVDGYYTPNQFTVKSGTPVNVVFKVEGKPAKACVSKPTFKALNKTVTVTEGEQAIELGALEPGTYEFSCAMGANKGTITVE